MQYAHSSRIAVIENEYADLSIDGYLLSTSNAPFQLIEMNKGSLFCICQFSSFKTVLKELNDNYRPEMILVEATGVADPISIAQLFDDAFIAQNFYMAHIFALVDSLRFMTIAQGLKSVSHQIRVADTVLINKTDLISSQALTQVKAQIAALNPYAQQLEVVHGEIDLPTYLASMNVSRYAKCQGELTQRAEPSLYTQVYKSVESLSKESVYNFFASLTNATYRIKGYIYIDGKHYIAQYVTGDLSLTQCDATEHYNELIAIGSEIINLRKLEICNT